MAEPSRPVVRRQRMSEEDQQLLDTARQFIRAGNQFVPQVNNFIQSLRDTQREVRDLRDQVKKQRRETGDTVVILHFLTVVSALVGGFVIFFFVPWDAAHWAVMLLAKLCGLIALVLGTFLSGLLTALDKNIHQL